MPASWFPLLVLEQQFVLDMVLPTAMLELNLDLQRRVREWQHVVDTSQRVDETMSAVNRNTKGDLKSGSSVD